VVFRIGLLLIVTGLAFGLLLHGAFVQVGFFSLLIGGLVVAGTLPRVMAVRHPQTEQSPNRDAPTSRTPARRHAA
jgi:hypothetical protein